MLDQVVHLAKLAQASGLDGVVASPQEISRDPRGMRPGLSDRDAGHQARRTRQGKDDQARTLTPAEAVEAGATYLVIGRPITAAADPAPRLKQSPPRRPRPSRTGPTRKGRPSGRPF